MQTVFLNGQFMPLSEARISPLDRGFLFGDGIYEVVPSYAGKFVGFDLHLQRLRRGLDEIEIRGGMTDTRWREIATKLLRKSEGENLAVYLQVTRGADEKRFHAYPDGITPTEFACCFPIAPSVTAADSLSEGRRAILQADRRWRRCHIKTTALLGNVMHFEQGIRQNYSEVILYNEAEQITEASASNVFAVIDGCICTPPLDHQKLAGITRHILLEVLSKQHEWPVSVREISLDELKLAQEVWLTSASLEVTPVVTLDDMAVGTGNPGTVWQSVRRLYNTHKFEY